MKRIIILTGIIVAGLFTSCQNSIDNYLDTPSQSSLDESLIFSNPTLAKGAIDGIKIAFGDTNSYRGRFLPWYGMNTDVEWYNSSESITDDKPTICTYATTPLNSQMNTIDNAWARMYVGIERANICIRGLRKYGNPTPGSEMGQLLGTALTLRAIYYADLMKAWGDVPARFEPISSETLYLPRTDRDLIIKQLIQDLGEASDLVAWPNATTATTSVEQINKAFVKGFRARLAMVAGGFQQYSDGVRRSTDPDLSVEKMYTLALKECRDVIASGKAKLEPSFETFWKNYNKSTVLTAGGESLWEIPFAPGRGRMLHTFAIPHNTTNQFQVGGHKGVAGPLPTVFYDYDVADTRRDVSCVPYIWGNAVAGISKQELGAFNKWYFGKFRYEWNTLNISGTDDGINKIYMRYAEVILIAAEAANEIEGPLAAAPYLKEIRKRAFAPGVQQLKVEDYVNALNSKEAMFNAIVDEHKFEFTGEMERKQALIRWNKLKANLDLAKEKMTRLAARTDEYADVPTKLYFKYKPDGVTLDVYGLNRGEIVDPLVGPPGYDINSATDWKSLLDTKIASLYKVGVNPDQNQFWPIWQTFIDASGGKLTN